MHSEASSRRSVESQIAGKFEELADNGWFPADLLSDSGQLRAVLETLNPVSGKRILDCGCARGRFIKHLLPLGCEVFGVDITEAFLLSARTNIPGVPLARGSISELPFRSDTFDAVYCIEALEHIPDTGAAVSEMSRVLKPGGTLLIIDKNLAGLNPRSGLPNFIAKPLAERMGPWMYPVDFVFRERWFWPWKLAALIRRNCSSADYRFLPEVRIKASRFYRILPFLSHDVAWIGRK